MKMRIFYAVVALLLLITGCRRELSFEKPGNGGPGSGGQDTSFTGNFRALIDGKRWVAGTGNGGAIILAGEINISGISSDGRTISILVTDTSAGTYALDQNTFSVGTYTENSSSYTTNQSADTSLSGGSISIASIDRTSQTISGTFQFNAYNSATGTKKVISAGVFDSLPYTTSLPPAISTDTFYAKINDTSWVAQSINTGIANGQLYIQGSALDGSKGVVLYMPPGITPGSYLLDVATGTYIGVYTPDNTTFLVSQNNGTLTILENIVVAKRIRGNFTFKATALTGSGESAQITGGYFSVPY